MSQILILYYINYAESKLNLNWVETLFDEVQPYSLNCIGNLSQLNRFDWGIQPDSGLNR